MIGDRYGRLKVILVKENPSNRARSYQVCKCDCGKTKAVRLDHLKAGKISSCGCFRHDVLFKHGLRDTSEYHTWNGMLQRCDNPKNPAYRHYGGRGITVCERWRNFLDFLADVGKKPSPDHELDRIDNSGNYELRNTYWATRKEQMNNTRRNHLMTLDGVTKTLTEWAEFKGMKRRTLCARLDRGWSDEDALRIPVGTAKQS